MIGQTVGNYRIDKKLGEGGLGAVYAVTHTQHNFPGALKLFRPEYSYLETVLGPAQTTTQTGYWGIVRTYEGFMHGGRSAALVTELLEGESLAARLKREPKPPHGLTIWVAWQVASALGHAHQVSVVHGLIKPESIFLVPDADVPFGLRVKVLDFGVAALFGAAAPNWKQKQTATGLGKPYYMAPEQLRGGHIDHRVDIYSLAALVFHMACRRAPFLGQDPVYLAKAHLSSPVPKAISVEATVPPALDALLSRNLSKEPSSRMQSMQELAAALEQIAQGVTPQAAHAMPTMALQVAPPLPQQMTVALNLGAYVAPKHAPRKKWPLVVGFVAVCGVGGGAVALLAAGGGGASVDAGPVDAAPPPDAKPIPLLTEAEQKVVDGRKALTEERWADALAAAKQAYKLDPRLASAKDLEKRALEELANEKLFGDFVKAVKAGDATTVARRYRRIPDDSAYRVKATPDYERVRGAWLVPRIDEARALAAQGECKRIAAVAKRVASVFPESKDQITKIACDDK